MVQSCKNSKAPSAQVTDSATDGTATAATDTDSGIAGKPDTAYTTQVNAPDKLLDDGSEPSDWKDAGFDDPKSFKLFLVQFKHWVQHDQTDSIAAHVRFPLRVAKTKEIFLTKYSHLFDDRMKSVVANQRLDQIFRNEHGAMFGQGDIWFNTDKGRYIIIAIHK